MQTTIQAGVKQSVLFNDPSQIGQPDVKVLTLDFTGTETRGLGVDYVQVRIDGAVVATIRIKVG